MSSLPTIPDYPLGLLTTVAGVPTALHIDPDAQTVVLVDHNPPPVLPAPAPPAVPVVSDAAAAHARHEGEGLVEALIIAMGLVRPWTDGNLKPKSRRALVHKIVETGENTIRAATNDLVAGKTPLKVWHDQLAKRVAGVHYGAAMAVAGTTDLPATTEQFVRHEVGRQWGWLDRFGDALKKGTASVTSAVARAVSYAHAAWSTGWNADLHTKQTDGIAVSPPPAPGGIVPAPAPVIGLIDARRILGDNHNHCRTCPALAALGWQPIEKCRKLGDSECRSRCKCSYQYRERGGAPPLPAWAPGAGPQPAPAVIDVAPIVPLVIPPLPPPALPVLAPPATAPEPAPVPVPEPVPEPLPAPEPIPVRRPAAATAAPRPVTARTHRAFANPEDPRSNYHELNAARAFAKEHWEAPQEKLFNDPTMRSVEYYKGGEFQPMNKMLRGQIPRRADLVKETQDMDAAFAVVNVKTPEPLTVFRVTAPFGPFQPGNLDAAVGSVIKDKGYFSTSLVRGSGLPVWHDNPMVEMRIRVPQGVPSMHLDTLPSQPESYRGGGEYELVFQRGSSIRITGVTKIGDRELLEADLIPAKGKHVR